MNIAIYEEKNKEIFKILLDISKEFGNHPFVVSGFVLLPLYYFASNYGVDVLQATAVLTYFLLLSVALWAISNDVRKTNEKKKSNYTSFIVVSTIGAAIYSASFIEAYVLYNKTELGFISAMIHAAINTFFWKIMFYITVGAVAGFYRAYELKMLPEGGVNEQGRVFQICLKLLIFCFFTFILTNTYLFSQFISKFYS